MLLWDPWAWGGVPWTWPDVQALKPPMPAGEVDEVDEVDGAVDAGAATGTVVVTAIVGGDVADVGEVIAFALVVPHAAPPIARTAVAMIVVQTTRGDIFARTAEPG